jgi:hypothetical protein
VENVVNGRPNTLAAAVYARDSGAKNLGDKVANYATNSGISHAAGEECV